MHPQILTLTNPSPPTSGPNYTSCIIPPIPDLIRGKLATYAQVTSVESVAIQGYWYDSHPKLEPKPGDKAFLHLHGGAYIAYSAHPNSPVGNIPRGLLQHARDPRTRAFSAEYRLSSTAPFEEHNPFPAGLIDSLAAYAYLIHYGYSPDDIVIVGDSAGGGLALALTRYLVEQRDSASKNIPAPPGALILLSPWVDLSRSHIDIPGSSEAVRGTDYVALSTNPGKRPSTVDWAKEAYVGSHGMGAAILNPYISPASLHPMVASLKAPFAGFPKTLIACGGAEVLKDQIYTLRDRMGQSGCDVQFVEFEDAIHDWIPLTFFEPERTELLTSIMKWMKE